MVLRHKSQIIYFQLGAKIGRIVSLCYMTRPPGASVQAAKTSTAIITAFHSHGPSNPQLRVPKHQPFCPKQLHFPRYESN